MHLEKEEKEKKYSSHQCTNNFSPYRYVGGHSGGGRGIAEAPMSVKQDSKDLKIHKPIDFRG